MSLFSIIVPIYKTEDYLEQCIQSVLNQSIEDYELILIDDGSPDGCAQICDKYCRDYSQIKVVHKENGGLVSARQAGIKVATGEYIINLDSDDWLSDAYLEKFKKIIEQYRPDVICCNYFISGQTSYKATMNFDVGLYNRADIERKIFPSLIQKNNATYFMPSLWAKAFKRTLVEPFQLAVPQTIKIGEDGACVLPTIYSANSVYIMNDALYYYRINQASMTKERKAFSWDAPEMIHEHLKAHIDMSQFDFEEQLYRKTTHEVFTVVVSQFYRKESYRAIVKDIKNNISREVYAEAIKKCRFSGSLKAKFMVFSLKYRILLPVFLYSKIKK